MVGACGWCRVSHETRATWRSAAGFNARQWSVRCSCGYSRDAASKPHAEALVAEHAASHGSPLAAVVRSVLPQLTCTCYDVESMEFDPAGPCPKCRLSEALDGAA